MAGKPILHGDHGTTLQAATVLAMLHWLGIKPSYSRPHVCDDNAFAESLFCTAEYHRPEPPPRRAVGIEVLYVFNDELASGLHDLF